MQNELYESFMGLGPKRIVHKEIWACPDAESELTGIDTYDHPQLCHTLKAAEKLQHHNSKLIKVIERTEHKLSAIAKEVAKEVKQVEKPE